MKIRSILRRLLRRFGPKKRRRPARRLRPPRNILVLGGSNTLMQGGYLAALLAGLEERFGPGAQVTNLAAGANSSIHGLMLAKALPDLAAFDLVIVEYGVNDVKFASQAAMRIWQGATEGLIRLLIATRPGRPIMFLHFLRRDMKPDQFRPTRHLRRLVDHYASAAPVHLIDVDSTLRNWLFPEPEAFAQLYSDMGHFRRPQIAGLVGAYACSEIAARLARRGPRREIPPPITPWHFHEAMLVDVSQEPGGGRTFTNSRFDLATRALKIGESLTVDLPGELACIEYVSHEASATLRVSEEGYPPFAIHTRHRRIGRFPFLLKSYPLVRKPWPTLRGLGPRRVTLEAVAEAASEELAPSNNMVPAEPGSAEGVFLRLILCLN